MASKRDTRPKNAQDQGKKRKHVATSESVVGHMSDELGSPAPSSEDEGSAADHAPLAVRETGFLEDFISLSKSEPDGRCVTEIELLERRNRTF